MRQIQRLALGLAITTASLLGVAGVALADDDGSDITHDRNVIGFDHDPLQHGDRNHQQGNLDDGSYGDTYHYDHHSYFKDGRWHHDRYRDAD